MDQVSGSTPKLRRFFGGIILRAEAHKLPAVTGRIGLVQSDEPMTTELSNATLTSHGMTITKTKEVGGRNLGATVMWTYMEFARFGFDLIAMMRGKNDGRVSSFYGMGYPEQQQPRPNKK